MRELDLCAAARHIESVLLPGLQELAATNPQIGDVRGRGAMLAIELVHPSPSSSGPGAPDAALTAAVARACHDAGLLILTCGTYSNVLRLLPPLVIPSPLLSRALNILTSAISAILQ
jgi:4-aminobutyrate aminotransferase/(S)-3-amino-2-methylpropionate transaminase